MKAVKITIVMQTLDRWELLFPKHRFMFAVTEEDQEGPVLPAPLQSLKQSRRLLCREQCLVWQQDTKDVKI